ncbi:hypothetical protein BDV96DRAFT_90765 [Lophiotrema nucula]|uniref:Uncharacterized protein n=1 Tax=Lophiotrema nucula TaxID=690887 RepID=A0A6A5Z996_9PLEO|nr:hypothetical protein BDV96DRAFT_90765 [Lophiotrema nucula]
MDIRRPPTRAPIPSARRNLFSAPTRRPNPHHMSNPMAPSSLHIPAEEPDTKDELVERNASGEYEIAAPMTNLKAGPAASLRGGDIDEEAGEADFRFNGGKKSKEVIAEHESQLIALYGKRNEHWDTAGLMNEIKAALQSSLEKRVQSLEHDRWMFEGEGKSKG